MSEATVCCECGNPPNSPNRLQYLTDDDGDPYALCLMCDDFQREWEAEEDEGKRDHMAGSGYQDWQRGWKP